MNELFTQHVLLAVVLATLISGVLEVIKERLGKREIFLTGTKWLVLSLVVSAVIAFGYTLYYEQLPIDQSVAIFAIVVLGPQVFYKAVIDKE